MCGVDAQSTRLNLNLTDPSGSDYATVATYRPGDAVSPRSFPDVSLAVDDLMPPAPPTAATPGSSPQDDSKMSQMP